MTFASLLIPLALAAAPTAQEADRPAAARPLASDPLLEVVPLDGAPVRGRLASIDAEGAVAVVDPEGATHEYGPGEWVKLARPGVPPGPTNAVAGMLVFPDGDRLVAAIDEADERVVVARSPALGRLEAPLEALIGLVFLPLDGAVGRDDLLGLIRREPRSGDLLVFRNGDRIAGAFRSASRGAVTMLIDDREQQVDRSAVAAVALDPALADYPAPAAVSYDLVLVDGSRVRLADPGLRDGLLVGTTRYGDEVELDPAALLDCYVVGGPVRFVSDLEPAGEVSVPYVGPARPSRPNATVLDRPLTVGGRPYARGLGTQSRSLLAYRLGPSDRHLQGLVALDDGAGPLGSVVFRVLVDGEERFATPAMAVGDPPLPLDVDVSGGSVLILATEFGRGGGVRDVADWLEVRLVP